MLTKSSFRDPQSNVLKAWGYIETNSPGDLARAEDDDFCLEPGLWHLENDTWEPYAQS